MDPVSALTLSSKSQLNVGVSGLPQTSKIKSTNEAQRTEGVNDQSPTPDSPIQLVRCPPPQFTNTRHERYEQRRPGFHVPRSTYLAAHTLSVAFDSNSGFSPLCSLSHSQIRMSG